MNYWQGPKVRLRAMEPDDGDYFFHILQDVDIQRCEADLRLPMSLEACRAFAREQAAKGNNDPAPFLMIEDSEGHRVGLATPSMADERVGVFACGIHILPSYRRRGYAADALRLILRYYFEERRCVKFHASVYSFNDASNALCRHLGLAPEGCRRKVVYTGGAYYDELLWGLTDEEYFARLR